MTTVKVSIPGGDRDCSSAVDTCLIAVGLLPYGTYMWTGNEVHLLKSVGYVQVPLSSLKRGDILWRTGHTEMYLGNGMQGGARIDERGGIHGATPGDQTGNEIGRSAFDQSYWRWESAWRYSGSKTCRGIPIAEATAQVMDHLIDHSAHGYSQDNREGWGSESITLTWGGGSGRTMLTVDGWLGIQTISMWQEDMGTPVDGVVSGQYAPNKVWYPALTSVRYDRGTGSRLVEAVQRRLGLDPDGVIGYYFAGGLQEWLVKRGYDIGSSGVDHIIGRDVGRALQRSINAGDWA